MLQPVADKTGEDSKNKEYIIKMNNLTQLKTENTWSFNTNKATGATCDFQVSCDYSNDFSEPQCNNGKIITAQSQGRAANDKAGTC